MRSSDLMTAAQARDGFVRFAATFALACWPLLGWAHAESGRADGLLAGLQHPVSGLDHVLAMVSVGLWGAQLGAPAIWLLPLTFPLVMAFGGALGLMGVPVPGAEVGIALSAFVLGLAIVWYLSFLAVFYVVVRDRSTGELFKAPPGLLKGNAGEFLNLVDEKG
jgi:hydrogenase/urease accessory protein HupE